MKFISWNGWKTYATVLVGIGLGVADYFNYTIPHLSTIEVVLGFLGIGFSRLAITNHTKQTAQDLSILVQDVLQQVTIPTTVTTVTTTTPPKSIVLATDDTVTTTAIQTGPDHSDDPFYNKGGARK